MRPMTTLLASLRARGACTRALFLAAFTLPLLSSLPASALIVSTYNGPGTPSAINITAPADDPGWANSSGSSSGIYLGDQWVLTANHVLTGDIELPGGTYSPIPGTEVILTNPANFLGQSLDSHSDLKMFRINTHPTTGLTPEQQDSNVAQITIATQTPSLTTEVMAISAGTRRHISSVNPNGRWRFDSNFNFTSDLNSPHSGFLFDNPSPVREKTWGTNRISNPNVLSGVVDNGLNVLIAATGLNDTVGLVTKFDPGVDNNGVSLGDGATDDEFQGAGGDSGGPVFAKNGSGDWELVGVFHAIYTNDGQSHTLPIFGMHSSFTDLSFQHYYDQITTLRASSLYSVLGDIDLDGSVTGEIIGGVPTGDLAALVDGWLYNQAEGDLVSWKQGDLNQDGFTNLADFVLLRNALGGTISTSSFALLVSGVPEPSTALLALLGMATLASRRRR